MSTSIAIGFSSAADPALALREASIDAKNKSGQPKCDLAVVLATPSHAAIPLDSLHKILQPEKLIGAVAPAIILSDTIETSGVAVLSLTSADILTGIAGTLFLKSKEMAEEMYAAMECRGFTGEYRAGGRLRVGVWDLALGAAVFLLVVAFLFVRV